MISTQTTTTTYTVADIRKVVDNFAADYSMVGQSTGLRSRERVAETVSDLRVFAEHGYLIEVTIFLQGADGKKLQAAVYKVNASATGWMCDRPGNCLWPKVPGGALWVIATLTDAWWAKTDSQRDAFVRSCGLHSTWSRTQMDTSLNGLNGSAGQRYASNGYGWERMNYSR